MMIHDSKIRLVGLALMTWVLVLPVYGQEVGSGTRNIHVVGRAHGEQLAQMGDLLTLSLDQTSDRPFAYVGGQNGWTVVDVSDPSQPVLGSYQSTATFVSDLTHFRVGEMTYLAVASDGQIDVFDISNLTNNTPRRVSSIETDGPSTLFAYRHSSGRTILATTSGGDVTLYNAEDLVAGEAAILNTIATPDQPNPESKGFEQSYIAYHLDSETDRFYGAGAGGYHVYDVTVPDSIVYITSATPAGVRKGHMVSATPDGRFILAGAEYRAAPIRIFDLSPVIAGKLSVVRTSIGAWTDNWKSFLIAHETRWPYVFVASGEQGVQVFNMRDPENPYTDAYFRTSSAPLGALADLPSDVNGATDIDVRNSDGLIATVDRQSGLWLLRLDAFQQWDGRGYGVPNISSVQDWVRGPAGSNRY